MQTNPISHRIYIYIYIFIYIYVRCTVLFAIDLLQVSLCVVPRSAVSSECGILGKRKSEGGGGGRAGGGLVELGHRKPDSTVYFSNSTVGNPTVAVPLIVKRSQ